jgi:hypothetical protein
LDDPENSVHRKLNKKLLHFTVLSAGSSVANVMIKEWNVGSLLVCIGAFAKLPKATITFVMSVRLSSWNSSTPTGWILMKVDV